MSPHLDHLRPAAWPWFTDPDLLLRAIHDGPLSVPPGRAAALHQALTRTDGAVTAGPWEVYVGGEHVAVYADGARVLQVSDPLTGPDGTEDDAWWLAAARAEAPALLAAVHAVLTPHWPVRVAAAYPGTRQVMPGGEPRLMCVGCLEESVEDFEPGWPCTTVHTLLTTLGAHL